MASSEANQEIPSNGTTKKQIVLNGFDMFTVGHLSFGQWRNPTDRAKDKRRDLSYWTDLAKLLEKGGFLSLFLADTYGVYDTYKGSPEPAIRTGSQWPMADPVIPVSAMAAVTKRLGFAVTTSTSYEQPYVVAKRFSTLDHLTKGRFGWNIVTSWKESASRAVGLPYVEHDKRYEIADEYLRVLYKLWEGSWSDTALLEDAESGVYTDYKQVRSIHHHGEKFRVDAPHIVDPSPQRTPVLFQAGTSPAGIKFGATHAEGIFVSGLSPHILAPRVKAIREAAAAAGRDPASIKVFAMITPIIGADADDARRKYEDALRYVLVEGGLAQFSATTGVDVSRFDLDRELTEHDISAIARVHSAVGNLRYQGDDVPRLTPRNLGVVSAIGGMGAMPVGTAAEVADELERWIDVADIDGFNLGYVVTPGSFEDAVNYLVPELRRRGRYPPEIPDHGADGLPSTPTFREQIYGKGQVHLRADHPGFRYKYDTYEDAIAQEELARSAKNNAETIT
ncbi:DszA family xenobiotic compound monooxygenase [Durotheca rogersii]|uniref:DszA family xenobiotic compound monooxygenase n=1 Tax=Durotheca rogersii TaxID=419775 RepID=UPI00221E7F08|nr:DszA family xenobiotic compound monooxygenase [Durotheca rogersii]KAI5859411.1 DszA family xenobiotic compound monooxygenase [Durotheca rogersii]